MLLQMLYDCNNSNHQVDDVRISGEGILFCSNLQVFVVFGPCIHLIAVNSFFFFFFFFLPPNSCHNTYQSIDAIICSFFNLIVSDIFRLKKGYGREVEIFTNHKRVLSLPSKSIFESESLLRRSIHLSLSLSLIYVRVCVLDEKDLSLCIYR